MPEVGISYLNRKELLSYEEMLRIAEIFSSEGVNKIRITGGEPFVRSGMNDFLRNLIQVKGIDEVHVTTNGSLISQHIGFLEEIGIKSINLSLDTLDRERFAAITRRDKFPEVFKTLQDLINSSIETKVNMVVMKNKNFNDILPMLELGKDNPISVRFIEEMPFNGDPNQGNGEYLNLTQILDYITSEHSISKLKDSPSSTSLNYQVNGFEGSFGIIPAYTRTICGSCNRLRLTPQGDLRTCLYSQGKVSLRDTMRNGSSDEEITDLIRKALTGKARNGFIAESLRDSSNPAHESMATIGG
jgi:cyclic pyranopterin phosphate synthase